jgi:hypothetical protein
LKPCCMVSSRSTPLSAPSSCVCCVHVNVLLPLLPLPPLPSSSSSLLLPLLLFWLLQETVEYALRNRDEAINNSIEFARNKKIAEAREAEAASLE